MHVTANEKALVLVSEPVSLPACELLTHFKTRDATASKNSDKGKGCNSGSYKKSHVNTPAALGGGEAGPIGGGGAGAGTLVIGELDYAEQGELL